LCVQVTVPVQPEAVKVALCIPQILVISADIVGAFGAMPLWICMLFELMLVPQVFVQVAV
jgi:hypothetical protein